MFDLNEAAMDAATTTGTSPAERGSVRFNTYADPTPKRPPAPGKVRISFEIFEEFAPAFRSAVEEISNDIGARLTGSHRYAREQALTDAAIGLAALRVATFAAIPAGDPDYV